MNRTKRRKTKNANSTVQPERNDGNSDAQEEADNVANQVYYMPLEGDVLMHSKYTNAYVKMKNEVEDEIFYPLPDEETEETEEHQEQQDQQETEETEDIEMVDVSMPAGGPYSIPKATEGNSDRLSYRLLGIAKGMGAGPNKYIYGVAFSHWCLSKDIFATCGDANITIYEVDQKLPFGFRALACLRDEEECFYSCDWSYRDDIPNTNLLIAAGKTGYIRMVTIDGRDGEIKQGLLGYHNGQVNDVKIYRKNPDLLATGSTDYTVRLWNVKAKVLIAIFGIYDGPRDDIVSVSFHDKHPLIIATGIDHTVHIWNYGRENVDQAIQLASSWRQNASNPKRFPTVIEETPHWITRDVHSNYIDCITWWGDWVITRGVDQYLAFWQCGREGDNLMELKFDRSALLELQRSSESEEDEPSQQPTHKRGKGKRWGKPRRKRIVNTAYKEKSANLWYLGHDVRIAKLFPISNSVMYWLRFSLDNDQKLLATGNCGGEIYLYYLGTKKDCEKGWTFEHIRELVIPPTRALKGRAVRQTAFNYSGNMMVAVSDECNIALYNIAVHDLPEAESIMDSVPDSL